MQCLQYLAPWLRFAGAYAWKDALGWASVAMTIIGTFPYYDLLPTWVGHLIINPNKTIASVSLIVITFTLAFAVNCVVSAPYRAWAELHALSVKVPKNSVAPLEKVASGLIKRSVRLLVKNRSSKSINCKINVIEIKAISTLDTGYNLPWLIKTITISPKDEISVDVASCFFGNNAHYIRIFNERGGAFAGSSVMDFHSSIVDALIEVSTDTETKQIWCKITWDTQSKTLNMQEIL